MSIISDKFCHKIFKVAVYHLIDWKLHVLDNDMMKFIINNKINAWKADISLSQISKHLTISTICLIHIIVVERMKLIRKILELFICFLFLLWWALWRLMCLWWLQNSCEGLKIRRAKLKWNSVYKCTGSWPLCKRYRK